MSREPAESWYFTLFFESQEVRLEKLASGCSMSSTRYSRAVASFTLSNP
jgi:hypothetical protein